MCTLGKTTLTLSLILIGIFLSTSPAPAQDDPDALVLQAWQANFSIRALEDRVHALSQKTDQAMAWMDPVFAVEYSNVPVDSFALGEHPMSGIQLKLQQTLPFPGKNTRREKVTQANAEVARYEVAEKQNQLRGLIHQAYWNLALVRQLKQITVTHIEKADRLLASVKTKYETGGASQQDLLRMMVLRERLRDDLNDFNVSEATLTNAINTALSREEASPVITPGTIVAVEPDKDAKQYVKAAKDSRPLLKLMTEKAASYQAAAAQASYEGWPDPTIWVGYRIREQVKNDMDVVTDEGVDFFSVGLSFPIPIFNKNRWGAKRRENIREKSAALNSRDNTLLEIKGDLNTSLAAWNRAYQKTQTYEMVLQKQQTQALEASLGAYQVGRANFDTLYGAQVALLDIERALVTAKVKTRLEQAKVQLLVGDEIVMNEGASK